jgi:hypothetical protein
MRVPPGLDNGFIITCFELFSSLILLAVFQAITWDIKLQDNAVMNKPVYGGGCSHRVFKYLLPLGEWKVTGYKDTPSLIPFGKESEKYFHLRTVLLDVSNIIDNKGIIFGKPL